MITFFIMLVAACAIAEIISLRHSLDGIEYDCHVSQSIVESDTPVELISVITNRKRRFVPFLRLRENVPDSFDCGAELEILSVTERRAALRSSVYMMPNQRLTRKTSFSLPRRGRYLFLGAELGGGDFLGFSERYQSAAASTEIVVLPKRVDEAVIEALPGGLQGDLSVNRFIHEDPMLTLGFREYTGREPMKLISWTQSARMGEMMVKNLDHTMERTATVILNLDTFAFGTYGEELMEKAFSLARGICETLEEERIPYSFATNAQLAGGNGLSGEVDDGLGAAHLQTILEGLGRATYEWKESAWALLDRAAMAGDAGRSNIVITPMRSDLEHAGIERIAQRTGLEPKVIVIMEVMP